MKNVEIIQKMNIIRDRFKPLTVDYIGTGTAAKANFGNACYKISWKFGIEAIEFYHNVVNKRTNGEIPKMIKWEKIGDTYFVFFEWIEGINLLELKKHCRDQGLPAKYFQEIGQMAISLLKKGIVISDGRLHNFLYRLDNEKIAFIDSQNVDKKKSYAPSLWRLLQKYLTPEQKEAFRHGYGKN